MKKIAIMIMTLIIILFSLFSCGTDTQQTTTGSRSVRKQNIKQDTAAETEPEVVNEAQYVYESKNRRDPFEPVLNLETEVDITKVKLVGFYKDTKGVKAILEDDAGNSYYLTEGEFLGNAKIVSLDIENRELIFEIQKEYYNEKKTLKLEE